MVTEDDMRDFIEHSDKYYDFKTTEPIRVDVYI